MAAGIEGEGRLVHCLAAPPSYINAQKERPMTIEEKLEKLRAVAAANAKQSPAVAAKRLVKTGIHTPKGNLTKAYGGTKKPSA
jgi:hypothetical protein